MVRSSLCRRLGVGVAWIACGIAIGLGAKLLVGDSWEVVATYAYLGTWVAEVPCGLLAVSFLLSATCAVGLLLWMFDADRPRAPVALPVYLGTVIATWAGPGGLVPGVACSLLVAVLAGVEVRVRRLGRWRLAVGCMAGLCFVELFLYGGLLFAVGC